MARFGLVDIFFVVAAAAVGFLCAVNYSWYVGFFVTLTFLLFWHVRIRPYAAVPGAAIGVLLAWMTLGVNIDETELMYLTSAAAAVGASLNCLVFRYYIAGALSTLLIMTVIFLMHFLP